MSLASIRAPGKKRLAWSPSSEAVLAVSRFLSCSLILASKEVLCDLPEGRGNGSQPNDQRAEFARGISCFSSACDDLAQFIQFAQHTVPVGLWLRQFGFGCRQALVCILSIGWIRELL